MCVYASRMNLPTGNTTITILNALLVACAKSSIGSTQVSFVMALGGVPVKRLSSNIGYWQRTRVPWLVTQLRAQKRVIAEKHVR